ncbi:serum amyloid P-component-like [Engystomops pustulosus]|uniref:serum amyloid P-component-like n=1 Tax=Engystomops pustulosus TaxID=76066 RepID=UPI003AFAC454
MRLWMMLWISGALSQEILWRSRGSSLTTRVSRQSDMREKLFAFPEVSNTSYVQIFPDHQGPFTEGTVCMRFHSDLTLKYSLISLATPHEADHFLLYNYDANLILLYMISTYHHYYLQGNNFKEWTSLCASWRSSRSVLFINEKKYEYNQTWATEIGADTIIILGQLQHSYGGGFLASECFVGEMTDVNMWDKALTDEDMMDYFADEEMSGNIIDWKALRYTIGGNVIIQPYSDPYPCEAI